MAHSKRIPPARVLPFKGGGGKVSSSGEEAIWLFLSLVSKRYKEKEAWKEAGRIAFNPRLHLSDSADCHIVSKTPAGYTVTPGNGTMTKTATKSQPKKTSARANTLDIEPGATRRVPLPSGTGTKAKIARGILRTIDGRKMTITQAAETFGIHERLLYRMAKMESLTMKNIDNFCESVGISSADLQTLGTPEP